MYSRVHSCIPDLINCHAHPEPSEELNRGKKLFYLQKNYSVLMKVNKALTFPAQPFFDVLKYFVYSLEKQTDSQWFSGAAV